MKEFLIKRKRVFLILTPAFLGVLYMALCIFNLRQSIWFDESFSSYLTRFDFGKIWSLTAADVHPPLYYFLLKIWAHAFGHVDFAMRMMSTVFGAVAILFAFLWLKYKYGLKAAMVASFLLSISPVFVRYGQEMRMYTMVLAIVFAATYFLQLAIDNGKKIWWIIYAVLVAAGMWTHYFAAFAWCAHLVYLLITYGVKGFFRHKIWAPYLLAVVLFLPWIPSLVAQVGNVESNGFWIGPVSVSVMANYFAEGLFYMKAEEIQNWLLVLATATVIVVLFLAVRYRKTFNMLLSLALVPLALLVLLSLPPLNPVFIPRYIMYAMLAIPLIAGVGLVMLINELSMKKRKKLHLLQNSTLIGFSFMAILVSSSIVGIATVYAKGNYNIYTDTKSASKDLYNAIIDLDNGEGLPTIVNSAWLYYDLSAYTSEENPILFINEQTDYRYGSMEPLKQSYFGRIDNLDKWLEEHESFWYVGAAPEEGSEEPYLVFPRDGWRVAEVSSMKFNNYSDEYQILKITRDEVYNND